MNTNRRIVVILLVVAILGVSGTAGLYVLSKGGTASSTRSLPADCVKPAGGFLIVASNEGYNDSKENGAPAKSWPVIAVKQGQNVTIVVCNVDVEPHGIQISHYYDSSVVTVQPGQVLHIPSFIATRTGDFTIYCDILCAVHPFMQNGLLTVSS